MNIREALTDPDLRARMERVRLLLTDVDGVLTDGGIAYDSHGNEWKQFHVRDGLGLKLAQQAGLKVGVISARKSAVATLRAKELALEHIVVGEADKRKALRGILKQESADASQVCYIGDDLHDIPVFRAVGLAVAVGDAVDPAKAAAHAVTELKGGAGAVREVVDAVLEAQGKWPDLLKAFS